MKKKSGLISLYVLGVMFLMAGASCLEVGNPGSMRSAENAANGGSVCSVDSDCTKISVDCCDCNNGGRHQAVSLVAAQEIVNGRKERCAGMMCAAVLSTDPSCSMMAKCDGGQCVLR